METQMMELGVHDDGYLIIVIRHRDKSSDLKDRLLGNFLKKAVTHGISLHCIGGHISNESIKKYVIKYNE